MGDLGALLSSIFTGGIGMSQLIGGGAGSVSGSAAAGAAAANPFGGQFAGYQPQLQQGITNAGNTVAGIPGSMAPFIQQLMGLTGNATQGTLQGIFNNPLKVGSDLTSSPQNLFQNAVAAGNNFAQGPQAQQQLQYELGNVNRTVAASGGLASGQQLKELQDYGNQFTTQAFQQGFQNFLGSNQQAYGQALSNLQTSAALQQQQFGQGTTLQQQLQSILGTAGGLQSSTNQQSLSGALGMLSPLLQASGATAGSPATAGGILSGQFANNQQALANLASGLAGTASNGAGGINNISSLIRNLSNLFGGGGGAAASLGSLGDLFGGAGIFGGSAGTIGGVGDTLGSILGTGSYLPGIGFSDLGGGALDIGGAALGFDSGTSAAAGAGAGAAAAAGSIPSAAFGPLGIAIGGMLGGILGLDGGPGYSTQANANNYAINDQGLQIMGDAATQLGYNISGLTPGGYGGSGGAVPLYNMTDIVHPYADWMTPDVQRYYQAAQSAPLNSNGTYVYNNNWYSQDAPILAAYMYAHYGLPSAVNGPVGYTTDEYGVAQNYFQSIGGELQQAMGPYSPSNNQS